MRGAPFLPLLRVLLGNAVGINDLRSRKRRGRVLLLWAAMGIGFAPMVGAWALAVSAGYAAMRAGQLPLYDLALAGTYAMGQAMVLFTAIPMAYAGLLRARDLSILLPLPYRPGHIVLAKLAVIWMFEVLIGAMLLGPVLFNHLVWVGWAPLRVVAALILLLTMPVLPLCVATLLALLVGNVPGLGRSRWVWQFLSMGIALAIWVVLRQVMPASDAASDRLDFAAAKLAQMQSIGRVVPGVALVARALTASGWAAVGGLLLSLALAAGGVLAALAGAERLYLRPVMGQAGAGARGRGRAEAARPRPFLLSCARREVATVLRDPAVAMNGLGGYLVVPISLAASFFVNRGHADAAEMRGDFGRLADLLHTPEIAPLAPVVFAGLGLGAGALGALSSLFAASFSKDGRRLWIERTLPVPPFRVFLGKWLGGLFVVGVAHTVTLALAGAMLRVPPLPLVYAWLVGLLAVGACGALGLGIDALRPKLAWKETVEAVKQNANVVFALLGSVLLLGLNALALWGCVAFGLPVGVRWAVPVLLNLLMLGYALFLGRLAAGRFGEMDI